MQKNLHCKSPLELESWKALEAHQKKIANTSIKDHFKNDPGRMEYCWLEWEDFVLDFSKNRIDKKGLDLLVNLSKEAGLKSAIESQFRGEKINITENRSVLHTALRKIDTQPIIVDGKNIISDINSSRKKMYTFCDKVIKGKWKGYTGKAISHIVNIGIGGSDLGPAMVVEALEHYANHLEIRFISNIDADHHLEVLKDLNPETTIFVIVSKTFSTQETLSNANSIRSWFLKYTTESEIPKHFVAVSSNTEKTSAFGITPDNTFPMKEWIGGRFSFWGTVGISICLAIGPSNFQSLLDGAGKMDVHFRNTPFDKNIPVILALISIWYNNFWGAETEAIIPYTQYLKKLPSYLQQAMMESNGKSVGRDGKPITYQTGTIVWGAPGTNAQHAFFQLIHQGTKLIPTDFIGFKNSLKGNSEHQNKLLSNFIAQTEAFMNGKSLDLVKKEFLENSMDNKKAEKIIPFKIFKGNKPTNTILIEKLTPASLGALISMYEHKIYVQGVLWNIYSYDQWGVELGKELAGKVLEEIERENTYSHDASTLKLLNLIMK